MRTSIPEATYLYLIFPERVALKSKQSSRHQIKLPLCLEDW